MSSEHRTFDNQHQNDPMELLDNLLEDAENLEGLSAEELQARLNSLNAEFEQEQVDAENAFRAEEDVVLRPSSSRRPPPRRAAPPPAAPPTPRARVTGRGKCRWESCDKTGTSLAWCK